MKICPVEVVLSCLSVDRYDKANGHFSNFCKCT